MVLQSKNNSHSSIKTICLILFLIANPRPSESFVLTAITTVFTAAYSLYGLFNDADDAVRKWTPQQTIGDVMNAVDGVSKKIDNLEVSISNKLNEAVDRLLISLPLLGKIDSAMEELSGLIIDIDTLFETFEYYLEEKENLDNETLYNYAKSVGGTDSDDLIPLLEKLNKLIAPTRTSGFRASLIDLLSQNSQEHKSSTCSSGAPKETLISDIYAAVMMTEMRGVLMTSFGYWSLNYLEKGAFQAELRIARKRMLRRINSYKRKFEEVDPFLGNLVYQCDAVESESDDLKPYFELTNLRVGYIINPIALWGDCSVGCDYRKGLISHHNCTPSLEACDDEHYCRGRLDYCRQRGDAIITLNPEPDPYPIYADIKNAAHIFFMDHFEDNQFYMSVQHDKYINGCSPCVCDCVNEDPELPGMHYISLREAVSDIENNKVVTGVRLVYTETCIHVIIQEGRAIPRGEIYPNSTEWETVKLVGPEDSLLVENGVVLKRYKESNDSLVEGEDYALFTAEIGAIFLDDVKVPKDYVLTGVRLGFSKTDDEPRGLQLEIRATPYDFLSGQMIINEDSPSIWLSGEDMKGVFPIYNRTREEYRMSGYPRDISEAYKTPRIMRSGRNAFYRIQGIHVESNAGRYTLPLMESLKNYADPPFALTALGFFFKSAEPNGLGVVATRLTLLDPIEYLNLDPQLIF